MSTNDIHASITDRIIELMEGGLDKWRKTWVSQAAQGFPYNASTNAPYSGVNVLLLWMAQQEFGYQSPKWLTYMQAKKLGGQVRKGESGTSCLFFSMVPTKETKGTANEEFYPMPKKFVVFNVAQIDGLPEDLYGFDEFAAESNFQDHSDAELFLTNTEAVIHHGGSQAFYMPSTDEIRLPNKQDFLSEENYYATAFHELVHWTSESTRCDRELGKRFGDSAYAMEELVAELGSAFLCGHFSFIDATIEDHASYLDHWLAVLRKDKKAFINAASLAQKAFDFLREQGNLDAITLLKKHSNQDETVTDEAVVAG